MAEEKDIIERALCRGMAMLMLAICLSLVLFFIGGWQNADWLITAGTIWMVVAIISALIIFNTSERFKNEG